MCTAFLAGARAALDIRSDDVDHMSDEAVLIKAGRPAFATIIKLSRLRLAGRVVQHAGPQLRLMLDAHAGSASS